MAPHTGFIVAAFAVTGAVLVGTVAAILLDYRAQLTALARLSDTEPGRRPIARGSTEEQP